MSVARIARQLAASGLSLAALVIVAELAARAAEPGPMTLLDETPYLHHPSLHHVHKRHFRGSWDGSWYETNVRGWRGAEVEPTFDASEFRVVALGDSCTFGKGVDEADCWPRQLERELAAALGPARKPIVANLGVNGYSGGDYVEVFFDQALAIRPHLVVIGYNLNDFPNVVAAVDRRVFQGQGGLRAEIPHDFREKIGQTALGRFLRATYYDWTRERDFARVERVARSVGSEQKTSPEALQRERDNLARIVRECEAIGAHVAMFLFPYESQVYLDSYARAPLEAARSIAEPLGIAFVEVAEPFRAAARATDPPRRLFLRGDRYHPDALGYSIVAACVLEATVQRGWIEPER
jgi:lysophospholipase L1-like esterase